MKGKPCMRALYEADSPDEGSPGRFASLRSVQGAASLAPLMWLTLSASDEEQSVYTNNFPWTAD